MKQLPAAEIYQKTSINVNMKMNSHSMQGSTFQWWLLPAIHQHAVTSWPRRVQPVKTRTSVKWKTTPFISIHNTIQPQLTKSQKKGIHLIHGRHKPAGMPSDKNSCRKTVVQKNKENYENGELEGPRPLSLSLILKPEIWCTGKLHFVITQANEKAQIPLPHIPFRVAI